MGQGSAMKRTWEGKERSTLSARSSHRTFKSAGRTPARHEQIKPPRPYLLIDQPGRDSRIAHVAASRPPAPVSPDILVAAA
jgi:hypothetical protein